MAIGGQHAPNGWLIFCPFGATSSLNNGSAMIILEVENRRWKELSPRNLRVNREEEVCLEFGMRMDKERGRGIALWWPHHQVSPKSQLCLLLHGAR